MTALTRRTALWLALASAGVLAACGPPDPPEPTTVALTLTGTAAMNGGAPAAVRVYYLNATANFESGDFFPLFEDPDGTLGQDLAASDRYLLSPGANVQDNKLFQPATSPAAIGVIAGFRNIDQPGWRAVMPLAQNVPNAVTITLDQNTVTIGQ
ncbi:MAG: type VI secretion system lipoprotein TssJ [Pseudomonadota bacterium]